MAKYRVVKIGSVTELTAEEAARLGDRVVPVDAPAKPVEFTVGPIVEKDGELQREEIPATGKRLLDQDLIALLEESSVIDVVEQLAEMKDQDEIRRLLDAEKHNLGRIGIAKAGKARLAELNRED